MDKTEHERMLARRRQARRRERLRAENISVTVTLTHEEATQLAELRQVRRMGKQPYSANEFFQLLLIRNWQLWEKEKAALGTCPYCGKDRAAGGCGGEFQKRTYQCWLAQEANKLNL